MGKVNKANGLNLVTILTILTILAFLAESAIATPTDSQKLRGLGGRDFLVTTTELSGTLPPSENCYTFGSDGTWVDSGFPVPGSWGQHSNGAATTYSATAAIPTMGFLLEQDGSVTPARGKGVLQIEAYSTFYIAGNPIFEFYTEGSEVDDCSS